MMKKLVVSLFLAFSAVAGTLSSRAAEPVEYLDWNAATQSFESKVCTDYTVVTAEVMTFMDGGWYVVNTNVSRGTITVNGAAHLILCDGAGLTLQGSSSDAGLSVGKGRTIRIYGQRENTGTLQATGGSYGAGIGGGKEESCGVVTINGGTVTARGAKYAADIGGGGSDSAFDRGGAGGVVTVCGGRISATGSLNIGPGRGPGGMKGSSGTVKVSGGVFASKPTVSWCVTGCWVFANPDEATRTAYPWAVLPACQVTVGGLDHVTAAWTSGDGAVTNAVGSSVFSVPTGASVTVVFAPAEGYWLDGEAVCELGVVTDDVSLMDGRKPVARPDVLAYVDADGEARTAGSYELVRNATTTLTNGGWYAVMDAAVACGPLTVNGEAHLVLCDGASLTATGDGTRAGVAVANGGRLHVYGQAAGTGALTATGGKDNVGLSGDFAISGGVFGMAVDPAWCATRHAAFVNPDAELRAAYPWAVLPACEVTVGGLDHVTAVWTSGDGTVTNAVNGRVCPVPQGAPVTVVFAPVAGFALTGNAVCDLGTVTSDIDITNRVPSTRPCVEYIDENGALQRVLDFTVVTADTATFANGKWYVVTSAVSRATITVNGTTRLILCDGAKLTLQGGDDNKPGLRVVPGNSIAIYGQREGTGQLEATGGNYGAGIGGGYHESGGTVTVNGGTVTATGGKCGAGIGGGAATTDYDGDDDYKGGDGGTVTINGGTVMATGRMGAGIGGGFSSVANTGNGGTVTINGGTVTASGGIYSPGIGGGRSGKGGTVKICGGCVKGTGNSGGIGSGSGGTSAGTVSITGGCFGMTVQESWLASGCAVFDNQDAETCGKYPWMVVPAYQVTIGELVNMTAVWTCEGSGVTNAVTATAFNVPRDVTVTILFKARATYSFGDERSVALTVTADRDLDLSGQVPKAEVSSVEYLDENGELRTVALGSYTLVTADTTTLGDGWYVVPDTKVSRGSISVTGNAHLILGDAASLTLQGDGEKAGLNVPAGKSLSIYGQWAGTGALTATGSDWGAGIGGNSRENCGTVTINGGTVTATGGKSGSGIGGGLKGAGGTVTVNGGTVTATGGKSGSGIGVGSGGAGGTVTINGGTVTATGGEYGAGIGAGGIVEIYGGRVSATGMNGADAINSQKTSISGGVFDMELKPGWLADRFLVHANADPETSKAYKWTVVPACRVTVGDLENLSIAWTAGDGSGTFTASVPSFLVYSNMSATVVFTPENGYWLEGERVWELGVVTEDWDLTDRVPVARPINLAYVKEDGKGGTVSGYAVVHATTNTLGSGWYAVLDADVTCERLTVTGAAKLILGNGAKLSVLDGITVEEGASLTVYGQAGNAGFLAAQGGEGEPGIGGEGSVTIVGGTVTAAGDGDGVPGIGAKSVVIRGGSVGANVLNARNASGAALWRVTVEGLGADAPTFADLPGGYGSAGITPVDGEVWLWWPNGTYGFKVNGEIYCATVRDANAVATKAQWTVGPGVTAAWADGTLTISGKGTVDDFASADDVPWRGLPVTNVTIPTEVKPGRNLLAGLADTTTINGAVPISLVCELSGDFLAGEVAPAEAEVLEVSGGTIWMNVNVSTRTDLQGDDWSRVRPTRVELTPEGEVRVAVPADGNQGFYRLRSK